MTLPDIRPREPIGAAVTIGIKGPTGAPAERDRWHIVLPQQGDDARKAPHPAFGAFNSAPPERRQVLYGSIAHHRESDCYSAGYVAFRGPGRPPHPQGKPWCAGDGRHAERWDGAAFRGMMCPGERCECRQGAKPACTRKLRLVFRLHWLVAGLPTAPARFDSASVHTMANFEGFFASIRDTAAGFGLTSWSLYGLRFQLVLSQQTSRAAKTRFPVVAIAPLDDLAAFFASQFEQRDKFLAAPQIAGLFDAPPDSADLRHHVPGEPTP